MPEIALKNATLRHWRMDDVQDLARFANNRAVWRNVRDLFPHPYTLDHAHQYLTVVTQQKPQSCFAIEVDGQAGGSISLKLGSDVIRLSSEIGYWLGEPFWGRGIVSEAVIAMVQYGFHELGLVRIYAEVFAWNPASMKVLEKAGFKLEGIMRDSALKDGQLIDQYLYARIKKQEP